MGRCERCGAETEGKRCDLCKKEQGIISFNRLTSVYTVLKKEFQTRQHGFTIGEATNELPYNYSFTMKLLDKLCNLGILKEYKNYPGFNHFKFTGKTLNDFKPAKRHKKKDFNETNKPSQTCQNCGATLRHENHIVCRKCRPLWIEELYQKIRPLLDDGEPRQIKEISVNLNDVKSSSLYSILNEMISLGWIKSIKKDNKRYYILAEKINQPQPTVKADFTTPKPIISTDKVEQKDTAQNIIIDTIHQILPGLLKSDKFELETQYNNIIAYFKNQKEVLDLYETLPDNLKKYVELTLDKSHPSQKILIPLNNSSGGLGENG